MRILAQRRGMTLLEVLLVVFIIGLLAALLLPAINLALRSRQNAECARKLRQGIQAFELYASETGAYPPDSTPGIIPPEMAGYYFPYFRVDAWWTQATELGGLFDWDAGYHGFAASVSISRPTVSNEQLAEFDRLVDDGNLDTGNLRLIGAQLHYILKE